MATMAKKRKRRRIKRVCPNHGVKLVGKPTRFGTRYTCPEPGCTVRCWPGDTSRPGDQEACDLRHACHGRFDPLWEAKRSFETRGAAYRWLATTLNIHIRECHFGMFSADRCRLALEAIERLDPGATP